jgi:hypothetical protein
MATAGGAQLEGRVALVTGAVRRIGRAIALALAADGAAVVINTRSSRAEAEAVAAEIEAGGGQALVYLADVTDEKAVATMVDAAAQRFGRLDILINNAAGPQRRLMERIDHGASRRGEGDVLAIRRLWRRASRSTRCADPERRLVLRGAVARRDELGRIRDLHDPLVPKRREHLVVESPRALEVSDRERDLIQHRHALQARFPKDSPGAAIRRPGRLGGRWICSRSQQPARMRRSCATYTRRGQRREAGRGDPGEPAERPI